MNHNTTIVHYLCPNCKSDSTIVSNYLPLYDEHHNLHSTERICQDCGCVFLNVFVCNEQKIIKFREFTKLMKQYKGTLDLLSK